MNTFKINLKNIIAKTFNNNVSQENFDIYKITKNSWVINLGNLCKDVKNTLIKLEESIMKQVDYTLTGVSKKS